MSVFKFSYKSIWVHRKQPKRVEFSISLFLPSLTLSLSVQQCVTNVIVLYEMTYVEVGKQDVHNDIFHIMYTLCSFLDCYLSPSPFTSSLPRWQTLKNSHIHKHLTLILAYAKFELPFELEQARAFFEWDSYAEMKTGTMEYWFCRWNFSEYVILRIQCSQKVTNKSAGEMGNYISVKNFN